MVGCRHGAKNTLVKNYLWFAERLGARVLPERHATEIRLSARRMARAATWSRACARARGCAANGAR